MGIRIQFRILIQGFDEQKFYNFIVEINKLKKIAIFYPPAFTKDVKAIGEAPSHQNRIFSTSNNTIFNF
jgi:hypothetical protein